jgi:hypothetical protein
MCSLMMSSGTKTPKDLGPREHAWQTVRPNLSNRSGIWLTWKESPYASLWHILRYPLMSLSDLLSIIYLMYEHFCLVLLLRLYLFFIHVFYVNSCKFKQIYFQKDRPITVYMAEHFCWLRFLLEFHVGVSCTCECMCIFILCLLLLLCIILILWAKGLSRVPPLLYSFLYFGIKYRHIICAAS